MFMGELTPSFSPFCHEKTSGLQFFAQNTYGDYDGQAKEMPVEAKEMPVEAKDNNAC
jgi:hypothetical protein